MHTDLIIDLLDKQGSEITEEWIEHTPMRRMGRPSELQGAVVWMASEASSFMTGANIVSLPFSARLWCRADSVDDRLWMVGIVVTKADGRSWFSTFL